MLIRNGANIDTKDTTGKTALKIASEADAIDTVEILLSNGAKIDFNPDEIPDLDPEIKDYLKKFYIKIDNEFGGGRKRNKKSKKNKRKSRKSKKNKRKSLKK